MLQGAHERKISEAVSATADGDNIVVAATTDPRNPAFTLIHELIGSYNVDGVLTVKAGSRVLGVFNLKANQGITLDDEPGEDNRPRFECYPGEDFILNNSAGSDFTGSVHYSRNY